MSFPRGTEMFQFPRFAFGTYGFSSKYLHGPSSIPALPRPSLAGQNRKGHGMAKVEGGFPHSEIQGSKPVRGSPRLIAAYHVLHRLSAPRHPPDTLMTLDHSHHRCPPGGPEGSPTRQGGDIDARHSSSRRCHRSSSSTRGPKTFASKHVRGGLRSGSPSPRCTLRGPSHDGKGDAAGSAHAVRAASASCACLTARPSGRTHSLFTMSNNTLRPRPERCAGWTDQRRIPVFADGLSSLDVGGSGSFDRRPSPPKPWWSKTGSNRRPHACKARALPTELLPRSGKRVRAMGRGARSGWPTLAAPVGTASDWWAWEDSNFRPHAYQARALTN